MSKLRMQILPPAESQSLRKKYLSAFIDTSSDYYQKYIATIGRFSDGEHCTGYLWDCLNHGERITHKRFTEEVNKRERVLMMADDHSRDRVINAPLWPFPPYSVVQLSGGQLCHLRPALPEDLYIFDESMTWTLVVTHENEGGKRLCFEVRKP